MPRTFTRRWRTSVRISRLSLGVFATLLGGAGAEQAKELAPVFFKVRQLAERFRGEQRPSARHFRLNFGRKLPVVDPKALRLVDERTA